GFGIACKLGLHLQRNIDTHAAVQFQKTPADLSSGAPPRRILPAREVSRVVHVAVSDLSRSAEAGHHRIQGFTLIAARAAEDHVNMLKVLVPVSGPAVTGDHDDQVTGARIVEPSPPQAARTFEHEFYFACGSAGKHIRLFLQVFFDLGPVERFVMRRYAVDLRGVADGAAHGKRRERDSSAIRFNDTAQFPFVPGEKLLTAHTRSYVVVRPELHLVLAILTFLRRLLLRPEQWHGEAPWRENDSYLDPDWSKWRSASLPESA